MVNSKTAEQSEYTGQYHTAIKGRKKRRRQVLLSLLHLGYARLGECRCTNKAATNQQEKFHSLEANGFDVLDRFLTGEIKKLFKAHTT
jgi:hypothetical protein